MPDTVSLRRYISNFRFVDETGQIYMTVFDEHCQKLMGMSADELYEFEASDNTVAFKEAWTQTLFTQHVIKVRAKSEVWEDTSRIKCSVVDIRPVDYAQESKLLLERIRNYGV